MLAVLRSKFSNRPEMAASTPFIFSSMSRQARIRLASERSCQLAPRLSRVTRKSLIVGVIASRHWRKYESDRKMSP